MPPKPEATSRIVPGSGTVAGGGPPGAHGFFFFLEEPSAVSGCPCFGFVGVHVPGPGIGGGNTPGGKPPPPPGPNSWLIGDCGGPSPPKPVGPVLSFSADWKLPGKSTLIAEPPSANGSSNCSANGSSRAITACGSTSTRFAQRVRAVILPSVISFSPCRSAICFFVQKILSRMRYDRYIRAGRFNSITFALQIGRASCRERV